MPKIRAKTYLESRVDLWVSGLKLGVKLEVSFEFCEVAWEQDKVIEEVWVLIDV